MNKKLIFMDFINNFYLNKKTEDHLHITLKFLEFAHFK